jgi:hypothetical protein
MEALIEIFAERYRLRTHTDHDGTTIIPGKNGQSHVYEYADGVLAFMLMPANKSAQWGHLSKRPAAFQIVQNGDSEGCAIFDDNDPQAVKLVLKVCRIHSRRQLSQEAIEHLRRIGFNIHREGTYRPRIARQRSNRVGASPGA